MYKFLLPAVLAILVVGCQQEIPNPYVEDTFSISSDFTQQSYEIKVLHPTNTAGNAYPFVFLIDGHWHYNQVAKDLKELEQNDALKDIILVSIAYEGLNPNGLEGYATISELRIDDLTFPKNREEDQLGGKSFAFRDFIKEELLPELQVQYQEDPEQRTVMGHSLGGYFGIWEMLTFSDSSLFTNIEAGSPALWWADGYLMGQERELAADVDADLPFNFHTTMGSLESVVWNTFFDEFEERITQRNYPGLTYTFERYPRGHAANAGPGFKDGLVFFFSNK